MINRRRGFTLLEMLVSVSLFTVAVFIIMVMLFSIVNVQKKAIANQNAQDNLRFAFESMIKEIRTGRSFHCGASTTDVSLTPKNCNFPNGGISFTFRNSISQQTVTYQVIQNQLVKSSDGNPPCTVPDTINPSIINCQKITSPQVVIVDRIAFYVSGAGGNDDTQSLATIVLEGQVLDPQGIGTAKINLQATVSMRALLDQP